MVADLAVGRDLAVYPPVLVLAAPLASLAARPRGVLVTGIVAIVARAGLGVYDRELRYGTFFASVLVSYVVITFFSMYAAALRIQQERRLQDISAAAQVVQRAILSPPPPLVGRVQLAVRSVSATAGTSIGGDLYEVLDTRFGTRIIVGDVQGKGLEAVATTSRVLGSFRENAEYEPRIESVAERADATVRRHVPPGGFVTAALVEFTDAHQVSLLHCGHPPPLLVHADGTVHSLDPPTPGPPLGLGDMVDDPNTSWTVRFTASDTLVLYTDGVTEARSPHGGPFYPLTERLGPLLASAPNPESDTPGPVLPDLDTCAGAVYADLMDFAGGTLTDDAVILLLRRAALPPAASGGSCEVQAHARG